MMRTSFALTALALFFLGLTGCATVASHDVNNYGPYPEEYERIVELEIQAAPAPPPQTLRTVTSVTEPVRQSRGKIAGWGVWGKIRCARPNAAGGIDISERDYFFLLRDGHVVVSDYAPAR
jgi:hypothetical protein